MTLRERLYPGFDFSFFFRIRIRVTLLKAFSKQRFVPLGFPPAQLFRLSLAVSVNVFAWLLDDIQFIVVHS